jgi:LDH2 family malate/lactate/ureidoglycolate dehydrogenase
MPRVDIADLDALIMSRLASLFSEDHARRIADVVLFGEMAGRPSHGIIRLLPGSYGVMDEQPGGEPVVERRGQSSARVSGNQGMILASIATDLTIDLASETGFAVVTTRGSKSTSGSVSFYVERLANAGLVSMVSAGTPNFVGLPGGGGRTLGTNPIAFGIPASDRPFILDMATSAISGGDVLTAAAEGSELPPGLAVDQSGRETVDPNDVLGGGAVLPFGGHKGLGLALMVEILNKALTGAEGDPGDWGHVFVAFSTSMLGDDREIRSRAQAEIERLEEAGARIPGHQTLARRDESLARGWVDVDDDAYARLAEAVG